VHARWSSGSPLPTLGVRPFATPRCPYHRPNPALSPNPTNATAVTTTPTSQSENETLPAALTCAHQSGPDLQRPSAAPQAVHKTESAAAASTQRKPAERGRGTQSPHWHGWVWCVEMVRRAGYGYEQYYWLLTAGPCTQKLTTSGQTKWY
jgi:hypothetical protein